MLRTLPLLVAIFMPASSSATQESVARTVTVHVRDSQQRSLAGVEVALCHGPSVRCLRTDAAGRAVLTVAPDWAAFRDLEVGIYEWNRGREVDDQLRRPIGNHESGGAAVVLDYPATGRVRVILYDANERPVARLESVHLQADTGWFSGDRAGDPSDSAEFDRVPLGSELVARVRVHGISGALEFHRTGPVREGELVIIEGRLGVGPPVVCLTVNGIDGQPVASEALCFLVLVADRHERLFATTDAAGRVSLALDKKFAGDAWVSARLYVDRRGSDGAYAGMAVVDMPSIVMGPQDAGTVTLAEPPILVQGVVVDEDGTPLPGMALAADSTLTRSRSASFDFGGIASRGGTTFRHQVQTDALGQFTLRELAPISDSSLELRVSGRDDVVVEGPARAQVGERDVRIIARRTGRLAATFGGGPLPPSDISDPAMRLELRRRGAPAGVHQYAPMRGNTFRHDALPAGIYDLEFLATHMADPLRIEGVVVPAGGAAADPRLNGIDWSPAYRLVRVRVLNSVGEPLARTGKVYRYIYSPSGNRSGDGVSTDENGEASFFAPMQRAEIAVNMEGFFHEVVAADKNEVTFTLRRAPTIVATLAGDTEIPKGMRVEFQLVHPDDGPWGSTPSKTLRAGQSRTLPAIHSGKQRLVLMLSSSTLPRDTHPDGAARRRNLMRAWSRYRELFAVDLDVQPGTEPVAVTVELDGAAKQLLVDAARALELMPDEAGK